MGTETKIRIIGSFLFLGLLVFFGLSIAKEESCGLSLDNVGKYVIIQEPDYRAGKCGQIVDVDGGYRIRNLEIERYNPYSDSDWIVSSCDVTFVDSCEDT